MKYTTVIFDMDGLLIDSEPFWEKAGELTLQEFGVSLTPQQYASSTGLRTEEWIDWWFTYFSIDKKHAPQAVKTIVRNAIELIRQHGQPMPGIDHIFPFFKEQGFKIGLATSSPTALVHVVTEKLGIGSYLQAISSAEELPLGKPHPQVFINCAHYLGVSPLECIVFEDSFNGMIAAKAARMKCVVIPSPLLHNETRWDAADHKLSSLLDFNKQVLNNLK